jgi:GMP synthase (glutamine-hydrolysing)
MKCVAIRHKRHEDLGTFEPVLIERGWEVAYLEAPRCRDLVGHVDDPDLVVFLGGPRGVYEARAYPFLRDEIEVAAGRLRADRPTLGICLGSQVMAAALGARVSRGPQKEIGWYPIELERAAENDAAARCLAAEDPTVLHWHGDTFDLPEGVTPLARSERYERQGFRSGRFGYALQFHVEVPADRIRLWTRGAAHELVATAGVQGPAEIEAGAALHGPAMARQAAAFLRAYLDLLG